MLLGTPSNTAPHVPMAEDTHTDVVGVDVVAVLLALCPAEADPAVGV